MTTRRLSLAILGTIMLTGGTAAAQAPTPTPTPTIVEDRARVVAVVESIDLRTRTVLLRSPEDRLLAIVAGPEVRNLPKVRAGDRVIVGYYRGVAVRMSPPGAAAAQPRLDAVGIQAVPGEKPGIGGAERLFTRVRIVSVDNAAGAVTFTDHDTATHTVTLRKPEMRAFARRLKAGDEVDVELVEALAVSVEPAPR
ncbi:hypothetical protein [Dankookia rubra]|uniref:hypothetical protein n=1 Tax=Dankookia rubra TaxID=1442381 RepID=UPI001407DB7A|nr:hypothetical protein [Dankookia rubra]